MKTISQEGLKLIKTFEGCRLTTYDDLQPNVVLTPNIKIKGTLTIGWGHTGYDVKIGMIITQEQADKMLLSDLTTYVLSVNNSKTVPFIERLNQHQFDALVSFCYNAGAGNLKTLCATRTINEIPSGLLLYNKSKNQVLQGLIRRRQAEAELFKRPVIIESPQSTSNTLEDRIRRLEEKVNLLTISLGNQQQVLQQIEPPKWFEDEFPEILELINTQTGTMDFWRAVAVAVRSTKSKIK